MANDTHLINPLNPPRRESDPLSESLLIRPLRVGCVSRLRMPNPRQRCLLSHSLTSQSNRHINCLAVICDSSSSDLTYRQNGKPCFGLIQHIGSGTLIDLLRRLRVSRLGRVSRMAITAPQAQSIPCAGHRHPGVLGSQRVEACAAPLVGCQLR